MISFFAACTNNEHLLDRLDPYNLPIQGSLELIPTASLPVNTSAEAAFYEDIPYGFDERHKFDFLAPVSSQPTPLVIYIHGGGFTSGDKTKAYTKEEALINSLLANKIAFASINYRLLEENETIGVRKCLNDSRRALQVIRYYANDFNIDKEKIILMGGSAGAGTSLWIGLQDDFANENGQYEFLKESTKVKGIIATNTQSTYDVVNWHTTVFSTYESEGMSQDTIISLVGEGTLLKFYGLSSMEELDSPEIDSYRQAVDMLSMMDSNDPEIYVTKSSSPYRFPEHKGAVLHHPLHANAIYEKANEAGLACVAVIPQMNMDNSNGESILQFILRKMNQ
ncbi:hypothetical protein BKI52_24475 [marine bacterium AO1-C]|nr:hypothetical protein BKI52_24475 [marine bacterium AO1-C]